MSLKKEMFFAIFLGLFLGGLVALFIAEVPQRMLGRSNANTEQETTPTPSPYVATEASMTILVPEDQAYVTEDSVTISGKTVPNTQVVVTGNADESVTLSDGDGAFSASLKLALGANEIVAYAQSAEQTFEDSIVVNYSKEKQPASEQ